MKKPYGIFLALTLGAISILGSSNALAHSGGTGGSGGGGGGGTNTEVGTPFVFDQVESINGSTPTYSGTYTVTQSIPGYYTWCTVSMSMKGKPINAVNGTALTCTVYTSDAVTGEALAPVTAPAMTVLSKVGTEKSAVVIMNPPGQNITRNLDQVVIWAPDGTVAAVAHP